jgi:predicted ATP-dependent Lon-type protease
MERAIGDNLSQLRRLRWALGQNAVCEASLKLQKDYMQPERLDRGDQEFSTQCSIVLGGTIDTDIAVRQLDRRYRHLFEPLPPDLQDAAFLSPLVEFAVEMRRRTTDQRAKMLPAEFSHVDYTYKLRPRD